LKVFISWSGETSREIGEAFRSWLPDVLQFVQPYFTPSDIEKGQRWSLEIANNLETSKVGLICLTSENLEAPWLMFEAGAISKNIGSTLCPILFGVDTSQLKGPLVQFQATPYSKEEVFKFVNTINSAGDEVALTAAQMGRAFDRCWPELEGKIRAALEKPKSKQEPEPRRQEDMIEEMLGLIRGLTLSSDPLPETPHWVLLFQMILEYVHDSIKISIPSEQVVTLDQLHRLQTFTKASLNLISPRVSKAIAWKDLGPSSAEVMKALQKQIDALDDKIPF
jgi:hypothetical protein